MLGHLSVAAFVACLTRVNAYTWPNPLLAELDSQLYDRQGYNGRLLPLGMEPTCNTFLTGSDKGRVNVADWVRTVRAFTAFREVADV